MNDTYKSSAGFTVVELLTTLVIAALYIVVFFQMYTLVDGVSADANRLAQSNQITYQKVQQYENRNFSTIQVKNGTTLTEVEDFTSTLPAGLPAPKEAKVYTAEVTPTMKVVTVRTKYGNTLANPKRVIEYSVYIQESGLGR